MSPETHIVIIGGGISGLATLHFLSSKYHHQPNVRITLLEKGNVCGGNIKTEVKDDCYFETGPNGFLNNKPRTLEFVDQLGLTSQLVTPSKEAKLRYICYQNKLHIVPTDQKSFLKSKLLTHGDRIRLLMDLFISKGTHPRETIYEFGNRRLGHKFTSLMLDSMVTGIYAGDIKKINLKAAFPRIYELEQTHGSLLKALIKIKQQNKNSDVSVLPKGTLCSFKEGMGQLTQRIYEKYKNHILLNQEVCSIKKQDAQFLVQTPSAVYKADHLILSATSYQASSFVKEYSLGFSEELAKIDYVPVVVVGLTYLKKDFLEQPKGFGYLIPSCEYSSILGVLYEHNVFANRCRENQVYFRLMMGGSHNRAITNQSKEEWISNACEHINARFNLTNVKPQNVFLSSYVKGIPQYDNNLVNVNGWIDEFIKNEPNLHFVANYRGGVSLNDCIENAYQCSLKI